MPSPIDNLYREIYGVLPPKDGLAYERLASAVCKLLEPHSPVFHDQRMRGLFSKTLYQLDIRSDTGQGACFGEAKDYTLDSRKVGRADVQKLAGALSDLPVAGGQFFSATDYTQPARQYAAHAREISGKPIDLIDLRPTVEEDLDGRVLSIGVRVHVLSPNFHNAFKPIITPEGYSVLKTITSPVEKQIALEISEILDDKGNALTTLLELTSTKYSECDSEVANGCLMTPGGHLSILGKLVGIHGLEYDIKYTVQVLDIVVQVDGKATLTAKNADGTLDKIITDTDLKSVYFDANNEAHLRRSGHLPVQSSPEVLHP